MITQKNSACNIPKMKLAITGLLHVELTKKRA